MDAKLITKYSRELKVLVVDDEKFVRDSIESILKKFFRRVYKASNGKEALDVWQKNMDDIDLVVSDISMPELNGVGLAKRLREQTKDLKIIMVSAYSEVEYFLELINLGVDGFILKPINVNQFLEQIYKVTKSIFETKAITSYQEGLESYLDYVIKQTLKLSKAEAVLKSIIEEYSDEEIRHLIKIAKKHNLQASPILQAYAQKRKHQGVSMPEIINAEEEQKQKELSRKEPAKIPNKTSAVEYLEKIEFHKYFSDVQEELIYLSELAADIYETLEYKDVTEDVVRRIGYLYSKYASTLFKFAEFSLLAGNVQKMGEFYHDVDVEKLLSKTDKKSFKSVTLFFITDLENWKDAVFIRKDAVDIHYLDDQSRSIAEQIVTIFDEESEDDDTIMLF